MSDVKDPISEILTYLRALVAIPTAYPPGETTAMATYLHEVLSQMGYSTDIVSCEPGQDNVVARLGSGSPSLVFNVHVDTVDAGDLTLWRSPPHETTQADDKVFGLGVANCKGSGAVQLWLAQEIARRGGPEQGEVVFTFVADEESLGNNGMKFVCDSGLVKPDMLLLGAPTDNTVTNVERGVLWVELTTHGRPAHAGQPEDGDNAILRMVRVLDFLNKEMSARLATRSEEGMCSTMNIGLINGGRNNNVVPSQCTAQIDRRLLPTETVEEAFAEIQACAQSAGEAADSVQVEFLLGTNGFHCAVDGPLIATLATAIEEVSGAPAAFSSGIGVSDGRHFSDRGIEIVNFGPGVGSEGHASNESVTLDSLRQSARVLERMFSSLVGYAGE
ncbi:MAG: M20 family metallopeptidase [Congregibacter sp.]